jgi:hypothetical protein
MEKIPYRAETCSLRRRKSRDEQAVQNASKLVGQYINHGGFKWELNHATLVQHMVEGVEGGASASPSESPVLTPYFHTATAPDFRVNALGDMRHEDS